MSNKYKRLFIALQGFENSGKTSTLVEVCNKLINEFKNAKIEQFYYYNKSFNPMNNQIPVVSDIAVVIESKNLTIGICCCGDLADIVQSYLTLFDNKNCDIVICPTRSQRSTVDTFYNYIYNNQDIYLIPLYKHCAYNYQSIQQNLNSKMAEEIIDLAKLRWKTLNQPVTF